MTDPQIRFEASYYASDNFPLFLYVEDDGDERTIKREIEEAYYAGYKKAVEDICKELKIQS